MKLNQNERYAVHAEAFHIMTGHMAPGKDVSPEAYSSSAEERSAAWTAWIDEHWKCIDAMTRAFVRVMPDVKDDA